MASYGKFSGCSNYISLIGKKSPSLAEDCGYFGEKIVLKAQEIGLNTCWVALTRGKSKAVINKGEKEEIIISLGYGENQGFAHKNKELSKVSNISDDSPIWFKKGMRAVMLAPTAINQQKFHFTLEDDTVKAKALVGVYTKIDLGIAKYHFEAVTNIKVITK